jgi:methylmalonyl-CoA/ethylmalonyl-CoA epimerase
MATDMAPDNDLADGLGPLIERFDHVSMAVHSIRSGTAFVALVGGVRFDGGLSPQGDFHWEQYRLPGWGTLEIIAAVDQTDASHFINRFIAERGEGLHHLTLKVTNIDEAVEAAKALGFTVVGFDDSDPTWKEAFVHPKSSNGVLVQLAEFPDGGH